MKPMLHVMLLFSAMFLRGADATSAPARELSWQMHLDEIQAHANGGLRLIALLDAENKKAALEINIPGNVTKAANTSDGPRGYRFPLYLRASEADAATFAGLIAAHFDPQRAVSFVRIEEFSGTSLKTPGRLAYDGGTIFVSDPANSPLKWSIRLRIEPDVRRLTLAAHQSHN